MPQCRIRSTLLYLLYSTEKATKIADETLGCLLLTYLPTNLPTSRHVQRTYRPKQPSVGPDGSAVAPSARSSDCLLIHPLWIMDCERSDGR